MIICEILLYNLLYQNLFFYNKIHSMEEIQMALMEEPLKEINQFSEEGLQHISYAFRINQNQLPIKKKQSMEFDGKLHLDIKIDQLLQKIQTCKIQLAQLLQMHLPYQDNYIQIKNIQLSTLKPSSQCQKQKSSELKSQKKCQELKYSKKQEEIKISNDLFQTTSTQKQMQMNQIAQSAQSVDPNLQLQKTNCNEKQEQIHKQQQKKADQFKEEIKQVVQNQIKENQILQEKSSTDKLIDQIHKEITNFKKTIMLRQAQLGMIIFILQYKNDPQFEKRYKQTYQQLKKYVIPIQKIQEPINVYILQQFFTIESDYYVNYQKSIFEIKERMVKYQEFMNKNQTRNSTSSLLSTFSSTSPQMLLEKILRSTYKLKIINAKIITMAQVFPYACIKDKDDLFSFNKSHQRWQKLICKDLIKFKFFGQREKVKKSFEALKNNMNILNASMSIFNENKQLSVLNMKNWGKLYEASTKILKVALFKGDAEYQASVMISEPDSKLTKQIWNLPQQKLLKNFVSACLPSIEFSQQLYLTRAFKQYFLKSGKSNLPDELFITHVTQYGNQLYQKAPYQKKIPIRINAKHRISRKYQTKNKKEEIQQKPQQQSYSKKIFNSINQMTTSLTFIFKKGLLNSNTAILHIHGGGFISMSSFIHQTYTRIWANQLGVPIISVDYGKAPEHPYPSGLYDCFQAYMWTRYVFRQIYQTQVEKILIVGDSAGGNLAAALTTLLIQWNLPRPDGLVLVYPALNLNFDNYTPSLLSSLNDMILPHTFLKICLNAYLKDTKQSPETEALLSPIATSSQILSKFPKVKMFVGSKDPFHDDCCRLVQKINDCNQGGAELTIFQQFPHGFLQFDLKTNPHQQAKKATKQVQVALRQLLQQTK